VGQAEAGIIPRKDQGESSHFEEQSDEALPLQMFYDKLVLRLPRFTGRAGSLTMTCKDI